MDIDGGLLWSVIHEDGFLERLEQSGVEKSDIDDPANRRAFEFIRTYVEKHRSLPGLDEVQSICRVQIEHVALDPEFLLEETIKRKLFRSVKSAVSRAEERLRANDPEAALDEMIAFARAPESRKGAAFPTNMMDLGQGVLDAYRKVKNGYTGIPLPWPTLTDMTMGFWPKTVSFFVARPGIGKTMVAVLCARHAWKQGKRVLIVSPEMSKEEIAERFFVIEADASYSNVMRGTLTDFELTRLADTVTRFKGESGFWIIDSEDDMTPRGIGAVIASVKPDLVAVDSVYKIRFKGDRMERAQKAVDWATTIAREMDIPVVCFSQQNRQAEQPKKFGGGMRMSTVALTDHINQDAHAVFALEQDEDMKADKRLKFHALKLRRGTFSGKPVEVHWDFENMKFDEIERPTEEQYSDDFDVPF